MGTVEASGRGRKVSRPPEIDARHNGGDARLQTPAIWITWEHQRRNEGIASALGIPFHEFDFTCGRIKRYALSLVKTWRALRSRRPAVVFVQNPSVVLTLTAIFYGWLTNAKVVVDAHNVALVSLATRARSPLSLLYRGIVRWADLTIVTNDALAESVNSGGGRAFVLPDRIPEFPAAPRPAHLRGRHRVLFICTFAADEPYLQVIEAARRLEPDTVVYITGNPKHRRAELEAMAPQNVIFTGFVPEEEYIALLHAVDVVMDLTTRADCLVCGAYEGLAAERPLILSDNVATRAYFDTGVRYTDNSVDDLAQAVRDVFHSTDTQRLAVRDMKSRLIGDWTDRVRFLIQHVDGMTSTAAPR
jgi:glycosyltransferase involved in cell wall biosynthesis